jgi:hypothetical protein
MLEESLCGDAVRLPVRVARSIEGRRILEHFQNAQAGGVGQRVKSFRQLHDRLRVELCSGDTLGLAEAKIKNSGVRDDDPMIRGNVRPET